MRTVGVRPRPGPHLRSSRRRPHPRLHHTLAHLHPGPDPPPRLLPHRNRHRPPPTTRHPGPRLSRCCPRWQATVISARRCRTRTWCSGTTCAPSGYCARSACSRWSGWRARRIRLEPRPAPPSVPFTPRAPNPTAPTAPPGAFAPAPLAPGRRHTRRRGSFAARVSSSGGRRGSRSTTTCWR